ncbi:MAG: MFS transporter [Chloroflexota bacterium]|nr:MFS transporter [Chloroflexota bacterium]
MLDGLLIRASGALVGSYVVLYALEFGATSSQIGLMSTVASLAGVMALLPGAQLAEGWMDPRRVVLVFSRGIRALIWVLFSLLSFFLAGQPAVYGILLLRAMRSFTGNAGSSAWTFLSSQIVPRRMRGKYFAARNMAKRVAALLLVPAAGWLIDYLGFPVGYQVCFGLAAFVGALSYWAYSRIPFSPSERRIQTREEEGDDQMWSSASERRNFWAYCVTSAVWRFSSRFPGPFLSVYLVKVLGANAGIIGVMSAANNLTALPGQALFGRWLDRRGMKWTLKLSGLLIPFLRWGWLLMSGPWGALPIKIGAGFLGAGYGLSRFNMLLAVTPELHRARQIALYRTIRRSAAAVAPLLGGLLVDRIGFLPVFAISGCGRMLSTLLMMRFVREPHPEDSEMSQ